MRSLLQEVFFDNTLQDYLIFFVALFLVLISKRFLSRFIANLLYRLINKTSWIIQREVFVSLIDGPIKVLLLLLVVFLALDKLRFPSILMFKIHRVPFNQIFELAANAVLIIAFTWLLLRLIDIIAMVIENKADVSHGVSGNQIVIFFKDFLKVMVIFVGILLVIRFTFHKDIAALLAGFGIVGAALALSARESLENLIASFIIFFDRPFLPGDLVKIQNFTGTVERIGLRSTRIRTDQKTYLTVPNKQMVDSILDNLTQRTQRRGFLLLELHSATPGDKLEQLVAGIESIVKHTAQHIESFSVVLSDINKNSFVVQVEFFTGAIAIETFNGVRQQIYLSVVKLLEEMEIRLALKETEVVLAPP